MNGETGPRAADQSLAVAEQMTTHIISPAYCEREGIGGFIEAVRRMALENQQYGQWVLTVVDDGSSDQTFEAIVEEMNKADTTLFRLRAITLSRNFGQQAAIQAGLETAYERSQDGDLFVVLDSDLQHPPSLIPQILSQIVQGADHVQMIREDSVHESWWKRATSDGFYWVFQRLSGVQIRRGSSDFRGMSRRFLSVYLQLRERGRFNRGLFHWIGFRTAYLTYPCADRAAGNSKYTLRRMLELAVTGLLQFTSRPLILLCLSIVVFAALFCLLYVGVTVVRYLGGARLVPGWTSIMFIVTFWSGALALIQLLLAAYVARMFDEIKGRPIYVLKELQEDRPSSARPERPKGSAAHCRGDRPGLADSSSYTEMTPDEGPVNAHPKADAVAPRSAHRKGLVYFGVLSSLLILLAIIARMPPHPVRGATIENARDHLRYVGVPTGGFQQGCSKFDPDCNADERPAHEAALSRGFWIGQTEVTVGAYRRFTSSTHRSMPPEPVFGDRQLNPGWRDLQQPIVNVDWYDASAYCAWIGGSLPTEAQWEYAARASATGARYDDLLKIAWFGDNAGEAPLNATGVLQADPRAFLGILSRNHNAAHSVGLLAPNQFDLFDMLGNVWEWTADWYGADYYYSSKRFDPIGPPSGEARVLRGASWADPAATVRVSVRGRRPPSTQSVDTGFRCVL